MNDEPEEWLRRKDHCVCQPMAIIEFADARFKVVFKGWLGTVVRRSTEGDQEGLGGVALKEKSQTSPSCVSLLASAFFRSL